MSALPSSFDAAGAGPGGAAGTIGGGATTGPTIGGITGSCRTSDDDGVPSAAGAEAIFQTSVKVSLVGRGGARHSIGGSNMFRYFGEIDQLLGPGYFLGWIQLVMMLLKSITFAPMLIRLDQVFIDSEQRVPELLGGTVALYSCRDSRSQQQPAATKQ